MMVTAQERIILRKAAEITRAKNREIRMKIAAARKPGGKADRGRERDTGYLAFLRRQPCACGCGAPAPSDAAHIRMASPERGKHADRHAGEAVRSVRRAAEPRLSRAPALRLGGSVLVRAGPRPVRHR